MLSQADVAGYLLRRGLLSPERIVDGDFVVRNASSRNLNFKVEIKNGRSYLLKQGYGQEGEATVAREASVYRYLSGLDRDFTRHLPRFYGYDDQARVLVLELVSDSEDLRTHQTRLGQFPADLAESLGRALGKLHRLTRRPQAASAPDRAPWIFFLPRPDLGVFRELSGANLELIKILQTAAGFMERLDSLRQTWREEALLHFDTKWDNYLVLGQDGADAEPLKVIDWELASPGDPAWDIGSALGHYLSAWLFSIPITGSDPPRRFAEMATHPLDSIKPAIAACWNGYLEGAQLDPAGAEELLLRSVRYAATRLLHTAYESMQASPQLISNAVLHLQLSLNILLRPQEAAGLLLGLKLKRWSPA